MIRTDFPPSAVFLSMAMLKFFLILLMFSLPVFSQSERDVAARFAPIFYQALGESPRSDYITNFDFDGDWFGDNNWQNAGDKRFPLRAHVYYAVAETATHYFLHYAVFHPRDYKGGEQTGRLLGDLIRQGARIVGDRLPNGRLDEVSMAHENDLEGALVVVAKLGADYRQGRVVLMQTVFHNTLTLHALEMKGFPAFKTEGEHLELYIEPRGHGIEVFTGEYRQTGGKEFLIYKFAGQADDPDKPGRDAAHSSIRGRSVPVTGYDLVPIATTLWPRALDSVNDSRATYRSKYDFGDVTIRIRGSDGKPSLRKIKVGEIGAAFLGASGNMARPPWAWFDRTRRESPPGEWFFDPAMTIRRDFALGDSFAAVYTELPAWAK